MRTLILLLLAAGAQAAVVDKGAAAAGSGAGAASVTLTGCASANRAVLLAHYAGYLSSGFAASNTSGAAWNTAAGEEIQDTTSGTGVTVFYTGVTTFSGSEQFTITPAGNVPGMGIIAICFTSSAGAPVVNGANTGGSTVPANWQAGSVTPVSGGDVFALVAVFSAPADPTIDQSFALEQSGVTFYGTKGWIAYLSAPNTSALDPTWTISGGPHYVAAINIAFPAPAAPAATAIMRFIE